MGARLLDRCGQGRRPARSDVPADASNDAPAGTAWTGPSRREFLGAGPLVLERHQLRLERRLLGPRRTRLRVDTGPLLLDARGLRVRRRLLGSHRQAPRASLRACRDTAGFRYGCVFVYTGLCGARRPGRRYAVRTPGIFSLLLWRLLWTGVS